MIISDSFQAAAAAILTMAPELSAMAEINMPDGDVGDVVAINAVPRVVSI